MGNEVEIKLEIKDESVFLDILDDEVIRKKFGDFSIVSMNAIYFDTEDLDLLKHDYVIRLRKENGVRVCTLKRRKQELDSGVSVRSEWNKEIGSGDCSFDYFPEAVDELNEIVGDKEMVEIIETDFIRRKIEIKYKQSLLEFAIDYGKIKANDKEVLIQEIEIELLKGIEKDILSFIDEYLKQYNLKIVTFSKFSRGVDLYK